MKRPLVVAAGAFVCFGVFWGSWAVATTDVEHYTGLSNAGLGLLLSCSIAIGGLSAALAGGVTARLGADRMLPVLLVPWGVCSLAAGIVPGRIAFVATFALAIASAGLVDMAMNTVATVGLGGSASGMVRFHALFNTGTLCGAGLVAGLVSGSVSWRWTWVVTGVVALSISVIGRTSGPARAPGEVESENQPSLVEPPVAPVALTRPRRSGSLLRSFTAIGSQGLVILAMTFAVTAVVEGGIDTWGVLYLRTRLATGVIVGAGAYAAGQFIAATTRTSGGPLMNRLGYRRGLALGAGLAALGLAVEASSTNTALSASALALAAGGISLCWPLTMARLAEHGSQVGTGPIPSESDASDSGGTEPVGTAALVGGFTSAGYLGWLLGPAVVGTLSDHEGLRAGLLLLACLSAAACVTLAAVNPRPARDSVARNAP
jgi:MFS family permease